MVILGNGDIEASFIIKNCFNFLAPLFLCNNKKKTSLYTLTTGRCGSKNRHNLKVSPSNSTRLVLIKVSILINQKLKICVCSLVRSNYKTAAIKFIWNGVTSFGYLRRNRFYFDLYFISSWNVYWFSAENGPNKL